MQLYLVRHGIAIDREDPKCPAEAERHSDEEGIKKTREVARGIASFVEKAESVFHFSLRSRGADRGFVRSRDEISKNKKSANEFAAAGSESRGIFPRAGPG